MPKEKITGISPEENNQEQERLEKISKIENPNVSVEEKQKIIREFFPLDRKGEIKAKMEEGKSGFKVSCFKVISLELLASMLKGVEAQKSKRQEKQKEYNLESKVSLLKDSIWIILTEEIYAKEFNKLDRFAEQLQLFQSKCKEKLAIFGNYSPNELLQILEKDFPKSFDKIVEIFQKNLPRKYLFDMHAGHCPDCTGLTSLSVGGPVVLGIADTMCVVELNIPSDQMMVRLLHPDSGLRIELEVTILQENLTSDKIIDVFLAGRDLRERLTQSYEYPIKEIVDKHNYRSSKDLWRKEVERDDFLPKSVANTYNDPEILNKPIKS